jgi:hypothetical protein
MTKKHSFKFFPKSRLKKYMNLLRNILTFSVALRSDAPYCFITLSKGLFTLKIFPAILGANFFFQVKKNWVSDMGEFTDPPRPCISKCWDNVI